MATFHLDRNCIYTVDGAPAPDAFERDRPFALCGAKHGGVPVTVIVDPASPQTDGLSVTDFCNGHLLLSLSPPSLPELCAKPLQCECAGSKRHLVTLRRAENAPLTVETDGEYHALTCPLAAKEATASCARVGGGDLIRVTAVGKKTFCAVLFFCGDYLPLLALTADKIEFCDKEIVATDFVGGMLDSTIVRRFSFRNGAFCETSREFSHRSRHRYPDGLIGRLYLEKLFYRDPERSALISPLCRADVDGTIGSFERVFDDDFCGCRRGVFCLADGLNGYCRARRVSFAVKDGLIEDVCVLP